ncbi:hypothetical protein MMC19_002205 [Ptychographa xylographoides]|nr:hypothetical protein [Ptychographa xylographoides]
MADQPFRNVEATQSDESSDFLAIQNVIGNDQKIETQVDPATIELPSKEIVSTEPPYSTFTTNTKKLIILTASLAAFFSPLTSQIYFPALNTISADLKVSNTLINLTVTTYMIFQGLAPTLVGGFSDGLGRRPAYIFCFVIYIIANIALALQNSFAGLLVLRCVQSSGISGTVALANAVVADVVTSSERGIYIGFASVGSILGPSLSPIIGGVLSQYLGWKSVFWFLVIFGAVFFLPLLLFLPETCHKIVGDGSVPPPRWNKSLLNFLHEKRQAGAGAPVDFTERDALAKRRSLHIQNPITATLTILCEKETGLLLVFMSLVNSGFYIIAAGVPVIFADIYRFNDVQLGLVYVPIGFGSLVAAFTQGKVIDWNYRRHATRLGMPVTKSKQQDLSKFPIEAARLEVTIPLLWLGSLAMIGYGWVLEYRTNLAGPLILLFVIGYAVVAAFNALSILIVDIHPGSPATATAANNLVRCLLAAGATAVVIPMLEAMGRGWTYTFTGLVWIAGSAMLFAVMKWGPGWREDLKIKKENKRVREEAKREKDVENRDVDT